MKELIFFPKKELIKALLNKQQEVQQLKEELDISNTNYDILYVYFSQMGELLEVDTCEEMIKKLNKKMKLLIKR